MSRSRPGSRCAFVLVTGFTPSWSPPVRPKHGYPRDQQQRPVNWSSQGGFVVDDGHVRRLEQHARHLGFDGLRSYLQTRCDGGHSVPGLARELGESEWTITQVLTALGIVLPPRPQRLALQRRRYAQERIARRVAELGFAEVRAYLEDRLVEREWLLVDVAAELAADRRTVRRLMEQTGDAASAADRQATGRWRAGPAGAVGLLAVEAGGAAAELGFAGLSGYLQVRYVEQRWPIKRMRAELRVGRNWLVADMARLGLR